MHQTNFFETKSFFFWLRFLVQEYRRVTEMNRAEAAYTGRAWARFHVKLIIVYFTPGRPLVLEAWMFVIIMTLAHEIDQVGCNPYSVS